jgi:hypothetical protein
VKRADKHEQRRVVREVPVEQRRREFAKAVCTWLGIVGFCVVVCGALFPLAYEGIVLSETRHLNLWGWLPVFIIMFILLFIIVLSTGQMAQKTIEYRAPAVMAENLPAEDVLVRGAEEPLVPGETLP